MLHYLKLPEEVIAPLAEITFLQIKLLSSSVYAIENTTSVSDAEKVKYIYQLEQTYPDLKGRGERLINWVFKSDKRSVYVRAFATSFSTKKEQAYKLEWCQRLIDEVQMLLDEDPPTLTIENFFGDKQNSNLDEEKAPEWKRSARSFFLYFYENYLGKDAQFPKDVWPDSAIRLGRTAFLQKFMAVNKGLEICPICDQTYFYTYSSRGERIFTSLDHFFPKSRYPHFACHPYNLIPMCHRCNSSEKGEKDPFLDQSGQRRVFLKKSSLPYSGIDLSKMTYLKVDLSKGKTSTETQENQSSVPQRHISLGPLQLRNESVDTQGGEESGRVWSRDDLEGAIALLSELYGIPDHWGKPAESNRIRATLFRRMRQFLGDGKGAPIGPDSPSQVHNLLHLLLYYLDQEYHQKDPHAFAMTWMLAALMNEHTQRLVGKKLDDVERLNDPLLKEIMSWYGQDIEKNNKHAEKAASLLEIAKGIKELGKNE